MRLNILALFCVLTFFCCRAAIRPEKIHYNPSKALFEYQKGPIRVALRNEDKQLVDSSNWAAFSVALLEKELPTDFLVENDVFLRNTDVGLTKLYSDVQLAILAMDYPLGLKKLTELRRLYPAVEGYSDYFFMEGYLYEKLGYPDNASNAYEKFLSWSGQKYSRYFRGYRYADTNDSVYVLERNYARKFLKNDPDSLNERIFKPLTPRYYFTSNQPGFLYNPEDFSPNRRFIESLFLGWDVSNDWLIGGQLSYLYSDRLNLNTVLFASKHSWGFGLSLPIQLYRSPSNSIGIRFSPFAEVTVVDSFKIDGHYRSPREAWLNFGARLSASYAINQKLYVGGYYKYNNDNRGYSLKTASAALGYKNEYDLSAYYNLIKNVSLKMGVKNSCMVAGIYLGGLEVSYNLTHPGLILRTDHF